MIKQSYSNWKSALFNIYFFSLFGLMPMLVTPWRNELYYDGKIIFIMSLTLLFLLCITLVKGQREFIKISFVEGCTLSFSLIAIMSTFFSTNIQLSFWGQQQSREGLFTILMYLAIFYIFFRLYSFSFTIFEGTLICAVLISCYGILMHYHLLPAASSYVKGAWEQGLSTIGNRNFAGTYCTLFFPLSIGFWLYGHKLRGLIYSGAIFAFLIVSQTRSAWVALLSYTIVFLIFSMKDRKMLLRWMALAILCIIIFFSMNFSQQQQFSNRVGTIVQDAQNIKQDESGSNRVYYWKRTTAFLFERPLLGSGPDTYGEVFKKYFGPTNLYFEKAHNEYLQIAITLGYPALIIYLFIVGMALVGFVKNFKRSIIAKVLFCSVVGYLVQAFFNISVICTAPIFWAMLGIGTRYLYHENMAISSLE